jgi:uncharacterized integral membrane protein (TIGR00697 family)
MKVSIRFLIIVVLFVTCFITGNIVGGKMAAFGSISLPAAVIIFPFSYIFGDILTEVYGYKQSRIAIWLGFLCNLIFVIFSMVGVLLPPAPQFANQAAYEAVLGYTPRLLAVSALGYLVGEFANSYVLAKIKVFTKGRWLWSRTIGSTIIGEGLDTVIFIVGAYYGQPFFTPWIILWHWLAKVGIETAATPLTYVVVNYLKKSESVDTYDVRTNFNPFRIRIEAGAGK